MNNIYEPSDSPLPQVRPTAPYVNNPPPPPPSYLHGYVMGTQPPKVPLKVFDIDAIEKLGQNGILWDSYSPQNSIQIDAPKQQRLKVAVLISYIFGLFLFLPQLASIAISLHMVKTGQVQKRRSEVLWFSFIELALWVVTICLCWGYSVYGWDMDGPDGPTQNVFYWGWIVVLVWFFSSLGLGIPRVVFCRNSGPMKSQASFGAEKISSFYSEKISPEKFARVKLWALVCYITGYLLFFPHLISIGLTLYLIKKGAIIRRQGLVLACAAIETAGFFVAASLSWFFVSYCQDSNASPNSQGGWLYNGVWESESWSTYDEYWDSFYQCNESIYMGYFFLAVWVLLALVFGIIRMVILKKSELPFTQNSTAKPYAVSVEGTASA